MWCENYMATYIKHIARCLVQINYPINLVTSLKSNKANNTIIVSWGNTLYLNPSSATSTKPVITHFHGHKPSSESHCFQPSLICGVLPVLSVEITTASFNNYPINVSFLYAPVSAPVPASLQSESICCEYIPYHQPVSMLSTNLNLISCGDA